MVIHTLWASKLIFIESLVRENKFIIKLCCLAIGIIMTKNVRNYCCKYGKSTDVYLRMINNDHFWFNNYSNAQVNIALPFDKYGTFVG